MARRIACPEAKGEKGGASPVREAGPTAKRSGTKSGRGCEGKASATAKAGHAGRCARASSAPLQTHGWSEQPFGGGSEPLPGVCEPPQPAAQQGGSLSHP